MNIIDEIKRKAGKKLVRIVLPETEDIRILKACSIVQKEGFAIPILIGEEEKIMELAQKEGVVLTDVLIINPKTYKKSADLVQAFYEIRKDKGITLDEAREIVLNNYRYFGNMLVKEGLAEGLVSGSVSTTSDTLRPALQIIKASFEEKIASSFFLMELEDKSLGHNGCFIYADCGMIQNPTSEELAFIAKSSAKTFSMFFEGEAKIAFLSHSTLSSSLCPDQDKVKQAVCLAKKNYSDLKLDGEMQFDAAIIPSIAEKKMPNSEVAGHANILIFPDLDAGNIGYKITERLAHAKAYGPLTQGLNKPVNDLSRGCDVDSIVGVIAITALQAIYPLV